MEIPAVPPIPLLPRQVDPNKDFNAEKGGFFPLNVTDICDRLAPEKDLAPEGIASAFAQLRFVKWVLENQGSAIGREAAEVIRLVVLLQYLGYLEGLHVSLKSEESARELGWLGSLLEKYSETGGKSFVLWKVRGLDRRWDGAVFAASFPANPFVPGAAFYPDTVLSKAERAPAWQQVRDTLIDIRGSYLGVEKYQLREKDKIIDEGYQIEVMDPHLAASLSLYLNGFITAGPRGAGWVIALQAWQGQLAERAKGGRAQQAAKLDISIQLISAGGNTTNIDFGSYSGASSDEIWICPTCGNSWVNVSGEHTVEAGNVKGDKRGHLLCSEHRQELATGAGETVGPDHYGAYLAPDKKTLYVWTGGEACPPGAKRVEIQGSPGSVGSVTYQFNKQRLIVKGHLVSFDTVKAKNMALVARKEREAPIPVDVPIRGEYATLVDKCELKHQKGSWEIKFHGLRYPVPCQCVDPRETRWGRSAIVVWPPQEIRPRRDEKKEEDPPRWSIDYVAADTAGYGLARFRLIEEDKDGCLVPSSLCHTDALYRTEKGRVRYIEIGEMIGEEFQSMGMLEVKRDPVPENNTIGGQIVLDFGTSNSVVLHYKEGDDRPHYILSGEDPDKPAKFVTFEEASFNNLLNSVNVLPSWDTVEKPPRPFLPSLHLRPEPSKEGARPCIPPRGRGLELLANPRGEPRIISGLKWKDWGAPGVKDRVESLIQMLLLPAFWELRASGCNSVELVATYPLAFGEERLKSYKEILDNVAKDLFTQTGLQTKASPITSISESAAAINSLLRTNKTLEVALDVGGGTTDLAIHVGEVGRQALGQDFMADLAADSMEYAGRDFLRAVVVAYGTQRLLELLPKVDRDLKPPTADKFGDSSLATEAYIDYLEALLHRKNGVEGLDALLKLDRSDGRKFDETMMRWEALLSGLLFYIRRMVEGAISEVPTGKPISLSFNLFGQGWEPLRILSGNIRQPVKFLVEPRLQKLCGDIGRARRIAVDASVEIILEIHERKKVVAEGAFKMQKELLQKLREAGDSRPSDSPEEKPSYAIGKDVRKTFVGMRVSVGQGAIEASQRLEQVSSRPDWTGDPGYGDLLDELFNAIPEFIPGKPTQQLRSRIAGLLLNSNTFRRQFGDVRKNLIGRGQDDLNRKTWPSGSRFPARSLLAGFLTSVWRPIWSGTEL